jgi:hypothetical protein
MTGLDRRQILRSVGAGAGVAGLGAGAVRGGDPGTGQNEDVEATFTATVGSGFLIIKAESPDDEDSAVGIQLENIDGDIIINGEIYQDSTWQSDDITFPDVDPGQFIDAGDIDVVEEISFNDETEITVLADSISGVYDPSAENGPLVTGGIDLSIEAFVTGTASALGAEVDFELDFTLNINGGQEILLTTGESQELSGEAATLGCADPVVRVVSNNFTVPEAVGNTEVCIGDFTCISLNDQLGLPSSVPNQNFIELDLDIEWDDNQPFAPPAVTGNRPRDLDCDGRYEDIDGDGELSIMDVQTLFDNRNDQQLEANAEQFNFSDGASDRVSIFDVQALFARLQNNE